MTRAIMPWPPRLAASRLLPFELLAAFVLLVTSHPALLPAPQERKRASENGGYTPAEGRYGGPRYATMELACEACWLDNRTGCGVAACETNQGYQVAWRQWEGKQRRIHGRPGPPRIHSRPDGRLRSDGRCSASGAGGPGRAG